MERAQARSIWKTITYWGIDFKAEEVPSDNAGFYVVDIAVAGRAFIVLADENDHEVEQRDREDDEVEVGLG